ncbi:GNAT family N-acetyltransferase [Arthrobacter sp. Marseille-P9274]|uniref:GNAT family N-acetyltransferase n=1 Tax=Arthrobacter sp. Marseille-P9274 TaxID=2866572 RepID=UPI0021C922F9|nr:GNAT family N-acetyltransferase [Arthrobacter sp. Marseille-P9274]
MDTSAAEAQAGTIRIEQFPAGLEDGRPDARTMGWFEAVRAGFHDGAPEPGHVEAYVAAYAADRRVLWGAYDDGARPGAWGPDIPVATYGSLANTMNVGGGRLVPTHQITAVTVRPTHRRRGLLRTMITSDLEQAAARGLAVAALTASEATIYGRFGFGAAAFTRRVEVDVRERFALRAAPYGNMELVDPASMLELAPQIFAGFHGRTTGSLDRQFSYARVASGRWQSEKPEPNPDLRVAVHFRPDGEPGGYVAYKFAGWHSEPYTMKVVDLVAASEASYRELWRYLGSIDLVQRIVWSAAPAHDPLPWALSDPRVYSVTAEEDALWLRILDPVGALEARRFEQDGSLAFAVRDPLGLAEGRFRLDAAGGQARVERLGSSAAVDVTLDVDVLGSLYLGGVRGRTLAGAGRLEGDDAAVGRVDRLFALGSAPYCITHF